MSAARSEINPATSARPGDEAIDFAREAARIAAEQKTDDVAVLDLRGLSNLTDFFVIGTGTSDRQMRAVLDRIDAYARSVDRRAYNVANAREAAWILADYVDVVVHLFDAQHRDYYDLDGLWGDAPKVDWQANEPEAERAPVG